MNPINVIGIGQGKKDLTPTHFALIRAADLLVGGRRHLEIFADHGGKTLVITGAIEHVIDHIKEEMLDKKIVVLASGDPLFYGIGSTLSRYIDKKYLKIHTNISSVAAAFAAIGEPWHDAKIISLHGKCQKYPFSSLAGETKVAFLTDQTMDPGFIASMLISRGLDGFRFCVLENLGDEEKEQISWFDDYSRVAAHKFDHPNIVVLLKTDNLRENVSPETHIGMDDTMYRHSKGLITKSEIRSITLSKLELVRK
ncbi:MAG: precorrin-6y C5,15-methyltransferase (decarboxylating) subunit CbiE, partial [Desulfobacteraceae bacterium]|nr:precorrin-6y C5,15-methyltransferase (decarboxylating) subunit CbiE [Desulfobacteraceae bacterium]